MTYRTYDLDEVLAYAAHGLSAAQIIETLGLNVSERTIQRVVTRAFGKKPTLRDLRQENPVRDVLVKLMVAAGADPHICSECGRRTTRPLAIHATCRDPDVKDLVFVCVTRCATVADN